MVTDIGEGSGRHQVIKDVRTFGEGGGLVGRLGWGRNNEINIGEGVLQYCTPRVSYSAPALCLAFQSPSSRILEPKESRKWMNHCREVFLFGGKYMDDAIEVEPRQEREMDVDWR